MDEELTKRKELVFDVSLEMFSDIGYENVTVRDIAEKSGITVGALYNHFKAKKDILNYAYQYFTEHFLDNALNVDEINKLFNRGSFLDLLNAASWTFTDFPPKVSIRMTRILKIIYMRIMLKDGKASKIFLDWVYDKNWERAKPILEYGVSIGKFNPDFNIRAFFNMFLSNRLMAGIIGFAADNAGEQAKSWEDTNKFLAQLLEKVHKE